METYQLTDSQRTTLVAAAKRLHITFDLAMEMAINRFAISAGLMPEGDLSHVDFSQSFEDQPGKGAISTSLPGFDDRYEGESEPAAGGLRRCP